MSVELRIEAAERAIREAGFTLRYVEWCEDSLTPGFPGYYKGVTDQLRRDVKIGLRANPTRDELADCLEHELHHVLDPSWDCGNRSVLG